MTDGLRRLRWRRDETGVDLRETNGVIIPGVSDYQITCELHTVPADADNDGTSAADPDNRYR